MKYSSSNKPLVCMMTQSTCYKGTSVMTPKGVLWHSTGANNPWLKRYVQPDDNAADRAKMLALLGKNQYGNDWNHISHQAGLNAWIGKLADGSIASIQTLPWNYKPWGCGSGSNGSCNNGWMQFEICEDALTDESYFNAVYKEACELTAYYCSMYNINPLGTVQYNGVTVPTILCHQDSYQLKLGSNHGDIYHWFKKYGKTMDDVRKDVAKLMGVTSTSTPAEKLDGEYTKGKAVQLSTNFKSTEFDCHGRGCCSQTLVDQKLVNYLQKIRSHFGKSVNVSSGYRCATHNKNVGGATGSRHAKGQAADIYINGVKPAEIAKYAESIGILGIGLYETDKDGHFVHIDTRTTKSFWYGQAQAYRATFGGTPIEEKPKEEEKVETKELYRVRKTWEDAKSQVGAYQNLSNAKAACDKAGKEYHVYNSKGEVIYPEEVKLDTSKVDLSAADPKKMWNFFKSKGLSDCGVAGLMGNLYAESGLRPTNLQQTYEKKLGMTDAEYTAAVDAGTYTNFVRDSAGYGLAQWTYWSLKQDMLEYFKKAGKSIGDLQTQMEFLAYQLSNDYKTVWNILKTAKTIREASDAVLLKFERPADQSEAVQVKRAGYGQKYYDSYHAEVEDKSETKPEEFKPYLVVVTASALYYRKGPGKEYAANGIIKRNEVYTIVAEQDGWGKLKSGAGWICLKYTRKR